MSITEDIKADIAETTAQREAFEATQVDGQVIAEPETDEQSDKTEDDDAGEDRLFDAIELQRMIVDFYNNLIEARAHLFHASETTLIAKEQLETRKNDLVASGKITGTNDTQRKAQFSELTTAESDYVRKAEAQEREARHEFDQASTLVEETRALLRVAEMANGGRTGER